MPLEQLDAERLLDLAEAPKHGRMVDAEQDGGGRQCAPVGDRLDQAEIVPGERLDRFSHFSDMVARPPGDPPTAE